MPFTADHYEFEILRMEKPLRAILHRFAPQPADLEDLLQDTYSRLLSLSQERRVGIRNVQAFAVTTARHVAMDWIKHNKVVAIEAVGDLSEIDERADGTDLDEMVYTHQQLVAFAQGLAQLPRRSREVFTLRRVYGLSQKEIAAKMNLSEGAVEQLLNRAMRQCAKHLTITGPSTSEHPKPAGWLERWRKRLTNE